MAFVLGKLGGFCAVFVYVLSLSSVMASFGFNSLETTQNDGAKLLGGLEDIPQDKFGKYTGLLKGIDDAELQMNKGVTHSSEYAFVADTIKAKVQVVTGYLYHVTVDAMPKSCSASLTCKDVKHCAFKIWSRSWLKEKKEQLKILDFACSE